MLYFSRQYISIGHSNFTMIFCIIEFEWEYNFYKMYKETVKLLYAWAYLNAINILISILQLADCISA